MLHPHNHTEPDSDLVTFHASHKLGEIRAHLRDVHGFTGATSLPPSEAYRQHAEEHAIALSPEDQGKTTEAEKRTYTAELLRRLARDRLGELDHAHLPLPGGEDISIVATDEVQSWLYGVAIRVASGADL
jgi:hypothetical protein